MSQNQYPILFGTPYSGLHDVKIRFAMGEVDFSISPGQWAKVDAPSAANPAGIVTIQTRQAVQASAAAVARRANLARSSVRRENGAISQWGTDPPGNFRSSR